MGTAGQREAAATAAAAVACAHFAKGACTRGDKCRFAHDAAAAPAAATELDRDGTARPACAHFAKGACTRGEQCRFSHGEAAAAAGGDGGGGGGADKRKRTGLQSRTRQAEGLGKAAIKRAASERQGADGCSSKDNSGSGSDRLASETVAGKHVPGLVPLLPGETSPLCSGHGKSTTKRKVTKPGKNLGREYFCCIEGGAEGRAKCGFFMWAEVFQAGGQHLALPPRPPKPAPVSKKRKTDVNKLISAGLMQQRIQPSETAASLTTAAASTPSSAELGGQPKKKKTRRGGRKKATAADSAAEAAPA